MAEPATEPTQSSRTRIRGYFVEESIDKTAHCGSKWSSLWWWFALPEVSRGVVAAQGGIPRLANAAGHQLASEMLLLGKPISAQDAYQRFNIVNAVVPPGDLMPTALKWAATIVSNSPDAVQSTKKALLLAKESGMWEGSQRHFESPEHKQAMMGGNIKEGLAAFSQKRNPSWKSPSAKL
ncbi:hypothetical protein FRC14_005848 [Serendipita sp. 396]|nr:hypothetical protein FRC14_005848 [Serendipita sp. 396]